MNVYHALIDLRLVDRFWDTVQDKKAAGMLNVLISFKNFNKQHEILNRLRDEGKAHKVFLDAQTYSINTDGENPGLHDEFDRYQAFVKTYGSAFDYIASYDGRFNEPSYNEVRYNEMLMALENSSGADLSERLVPVVHDRDNAADEFYSYVEDGAKLIGIGSRPAISDEQWQIINEIREEFGVGIHIFGNLGIDKLIKRHAESADSTMYARSTMHGREVLFWDESSNRIRKVDLRRRGAMTIEDERFIQQTFGMSVATMASDVKNIWVVNMFAIQQMQRYLTQIVG